MWGGAESYSLQSRAAPACAQWELRDRELPYCVALSRPRKVTLLEESFSRYCMLLHVPTERKLSAGERRIRSRGGIANDIGVSDNELVNTSF
jgi:hypothetical protein